MSQAAQSPTNNNNSNKQILKQIKDILEREFSDLSQINQVVIKLSQRKGLSLDDLDAAREMMKINFRKKSISQMKQRKDISQPLVKPRDIQTKETQGYIYEEIDCKANSAHDLIVSFTIKYLNTTWLSKYKLLIFFQDLTASLDLQKSNQTSQGGEQMNGVATYRQKQHDPWKVLIQEDLNRYQKEKDYHFSSRKNSQASYKEYLEKQMEQLKAQKTLSSEVNQKEGDSIINRVKQLEINEKERTLNYRHKVRNIMEQNDNVKLNLLMQQQKEKQRIQILEKKEAEEAANKDKMQILTEKWEIKHKQRKVSSDLDFIKAQQQIINQTKKEEYQSNANSQSTRVSPRMEQSPPRENVISNPFVDKSDIVRHKKKIEELNLRNEYNLNHYDKYTVSPKDRSITKIESDLNFQTVLDDRNKQSQQESSNLKKLATVDNKNLQFMKIKEKQQQLQKEILVDKHQADKDFENSIRVKQLEIQDKKTKQNIQLTNLEQQKKIKQDYMKSNPSDLSPTEFALNKQRFKNAADLLI